MSCNILISSLTLVELLCYQYLRTVRHIIKVCKEFVSKGDDRERYKNGNFMFVIRRTPLVWNKI